MHRHTLEGLSYLIAALIDVWIACYVWSHFETASWWMLPFLITMAVTGVVFLIGSIVVLTE